MKFLKAGSSDALGAMLELRLPPGVAIYNMETLAGPGGGERELLLPRGILWTVNKFQAFDMKSLVPHVAKSFRNIMEVTLTAGTDWRTR